MSLEGFSRAIDMIYAAALDADLWHPAMGAIDRLVGGRGSLLGIDTDGQPGFLSVTGYEQEAIASFASYYAGKSYVWSLLDKAAEGDVIHDRRVMPSDQRRHDVFANEWATMYDTDDCVVFPLLKRTDRTAFAVFARSRTNGTFDRPALDFLRGLSPHLRRAAQLRVELDRSELSAALTLGAIDKLADGVIFATANGSVTNLNAAAERLLMSAHSGLSIRQGRLRCASAALTLNLQRVIARASGVDKASGRQGGALTVHRGHGDKPLTVFCVPLVEERRWSLDLHPSVLLLLSDTARNMRAPVDLLRDLFGLTLAEARLATRLGDGMSLTDAAAELGVAKATVRSQLNAVFQKTQTNRQGGLIRLLNALPRISTEIPADLLARPRSGNGSHELRAVY
jgi:DNA-binding CsgD family transcriptional regulator